MSPSGCHGRVTSAELCGPLCAVNVTRMNAAATSIEEVRSDAEGRWQLSGFEAGEHVVFSLHGFVSKTYSCAPLPELVRLLEDRLIGYQDRLWFVPGEEVTVCVHAPRSYSARLYRHGFHKTRVLDLGSFDAHRQNVPDGHFVETGLTWEGSFDYSIPNHVTPGLYSLLLETHAHESFAIPMVVSTPEEQYGKNAKLVVLASTNTWQSYNLWGGRSRYRNFEDGESQHFIDPAWKRTLKRKAAKLLPAGVKTAVKRALGWRVEPVWFFKKMSIRRPFTNCRLEEEHVFQPFTNHLAAAEWRLLAWLEREGIAYDLVAGAELHHNPNLLRHYGAIVLSTHCEYWSREMYQGLKRYHEQNGLWILNLSCNSMYREITFFDDGSTRCVSASFQRSCADETELLGVRFTPEDYATCAPYKILLRQHWVFQDIPLHKESRLFGGLSLNQNTPRNDPWYDPGRPGIATGLVGMGASGWETDKLSATASDAFQLVAKGVNPKGGADMVVRESDGVRGGVFSASSMLFAGSLLIDNVCGGIAKNVIARALKGAAQDRDQDAARPVIGT